MGNFHKIGRRCNIFIGNGYDRGFPTLDMEEVYRQALIYRPDVVITSTSDGPVRTAAYVNEKLGKRP